MVVKHGMCGNGIRCLAKYLYEEGIVQESEFEIETLSGNKKIELTLENKKVISVKVNMGKCLLIGEAIVHIEDSSFEGYRVSVR